MKSALLNLSIALVSTVVCLLVAEGAIRLLIDDIDDKLSYAGVRFEGGKAYSELSPHHESLMVHRPNSLMRAKIGKRRDTYRINAQRMRGPVVAEKKDADTLRVLMLGDSVTFGLFIPDEQKTFSRRVEAGLRQQNPERSFEVLNGGVSGYQIEQYLEYYRHYGSKYSSDVVVVNLVPYDCAKLTIVNSDGSSHFRIAQDDGRFVPSVLPLPTKLEGFLLRNSVIYRGSNYHLFNFLQSYADTTEQYFFSNIEFCKENVEELLGLIRGSGAKAIIAVHPMFPRSLWREEDGHHQSEERFTLLMDLSANIGETPVNIRKAYKEAGLEPKDIKYDIIHPNELGNEIVAKTLIKEINLLLEKIIS